MRTQVTVVPVDSTIIVDGEALQFDFPFSENIHAIQWINGSGSVEYVGVQSNKDADYTTDVEPFVVLWENEKARLEYEANKPPTLEEARTSKSTEINTLRDAKEQDYFVYDGSKFDSNRDAAQRINLADNSARNVRDVGKTWETEWTLYDNTKRVVTEYDLPRMVDSFSYWSGYCHVYATGLKEAVNAATTVEEVDAIDIANGWPTPEYVADIYENVPLSEKAKRVSLTKREFLKLIIALTEQTSGMTPITLEMIEGYVAQGDASLRLEWEYATFIERAHPLLDVAANSFGIPSEMLDIMYANSYDLLKKLSAGEPISS